MSKIFAFISVSIFMMSFSLGPFFPANADEIYIVSKAKANLRAGPGMDHKIVRTLSEGDEAFLIGQKDRWMKVKLQDNTEGWIYHRLLSKVSIPEKQTQYPKEAQAIKKALTPEWNPVPPTRSVDSIILEIGRKAEKQENPLVLDTKPGEEEFAKRKNSFEEEKNRFNSQWEKLLLLAQHRLDQSKADYTMNDVKLVQMSQSISTSKQEIRTIEAETLNYQKLLKRLRINLRKAEENYRLVYQNYRNYFVVLGVVVLPYSTARNISLQELDKIAFEKAVEAAEKRCIEKYLTGIETLKYEEYAIYIKAARSGVAYRLAPSEKIIDYEVNSQGSVEKQYYLVLAPICVQPKPVDKTKKGDQRKRFDADIIGYIAYDPAESVVAKEKYNDQKIPSIQYPDFLSVFKKKNREEVEKSLREFVDLVNEYHDPTYKDKWLERCKKYGKDLGDIEQQIAKYQTEIRENNAKIQGLKTRIHTLEQERAKLSEGNKQLATRVNQDFAEWKSIVLHRPIAYLSTAQTPQSESLAPSEMWANLARRVFKKALKDSTVYYRDSIEEYVFEKQVEKYMASKKIYEKPSLIKKYRILCKGLTTGRKPDLSLTIGFQFDLNLPEKFLRPAVKDEDSIRANVVKHTDEKGNFIFISYGELAWKVPNEKYEFKTWHKANNECVEAREAKLHGLEGWRLPTRQELISIKSGSKAKCCIFDELKIPCGAIFWTGELAKRVSTGNSYYVETFGFQAMDSLSKDAPAFTVMVADLPGSDLEM